MTWWDPDKKKHLGKCTAPFAPYDDGECYDCMFNVGGCSYLIQSSEGTAK